MGRDDRNHNKGGRKSTSKSSSSNYPSAWGDWAWSSEHSRQYRCRFLDSEGTLDYDYGPVQEPPQSSPVVTSVPRADVAHLSSLPPATSQYSSQEDYTTDPIAPLTRQVATATLNDAGPAPLENFPAPQANVATKNRGTTAEKFDKRYKVHNEWEFQWGKVFKVLWSEPKGEGKQSGGTEISVRQGKHGEEFKKVRRFVIISQRKGHCICLPIMSYEGRGTTKPGVHAGDHAIIYTTLQPVLLEGETGMTKTPIRVIPNNPQHRLDAESRLNYAKVYTVEYNVKVWFIGKIHPDSEWYLTAAYNDVHPPLPSRGRPIGLTSATTSGYAPSGSSSYQVPYTTQYTPAQFPPGTSGYSGTPSSSQPTAQSYQTSSYPAVATSSIGPVQSSSYSQNYSSTPSSAQPDSSYRVAEPPNDGPIYEDDIYGAD